MTAAVPGFFLLLSLIVALGAQNVFVLRQAVRGEHVGLVVVLCAGSDAVLILAGVAGLDRLEEAAPWVEGAARWGGAAFLLGYATLAARRALTPGGEGLTPTEDAPGPSGGSTLVATRVTPVVLTTLALTWLNPHVYLDTVFLVGSVATTHGDDRWFFAGGAVAASVLWFSALGLGGRVAAGLLRTPASWRVLDGVIAVVMGLMALKLAAG